jgi:two-component system alkaline phosphatase synthesis response regulator PhoP
MKPVVAYVDDDFSNLSFYKELLSSNFAVETFSRSLDLTKAMEKKTFDCFIVDIYMPVVDGFQLLEKIRTNPETAKTPVFLVTSNPHDELKVNSFKQGAADFFDRMIKKDELIARLESRIKSHRESMSFFKMGSLSIDLLQIECYLGREKMVLTLLEFKIVSKLIQLYPNKVTKADLVHSIWGKDLVNANNLNTHLYNLRMKLADWDYEIDNHRLEGYLLRQKNNE